VRAARAGGATAASPASAARTGRSGSLPPARPGWQHHPVCNRRYHFIIPSDDDLDDAASIPALVENKAAGRAMPTVKWTVCDGADDENDLYNAPTSVFDSKTHYLHGLLHLNGFGHLLRVNAKGGPSRQLSGKHLMDIWDNLCVLLRARDVSVEDISAKNDMTLRLLHTAAYGHTWYGKWGYEFGRGSFAITQTAWHHAVNGVMRAPLNAMLKDFEAVDAAVCAILGTYSALLGQGPAAQLSDLLRIMLQLVASPAACAAAFGAASPDLALAGGSKRMRTPRQRKPAGEGAPGGLQHLHLPPPGAALKQEPGSGRHERPPPGSRAARPARQEAAHDGHLAAARSSLRRRRFPDLGEEHDDGTPLRPPSGRTRVSSRPAGTAAAGCWGALGCSGVLGPPARSSRRLAQSVRARVRLLSSCACAAAG
jgi:hypothetical protein